MDEKQIKNLAQEEMQKEMVKKFIKGAMYLNASTQQERDKIDMQVEQAGFEADIVVGLLRGLGIMK